MIEFFVNGEKIEIQLENEKTIGEVLASFEQTCEENDAAVIEIRVNDKQISAEIFDEEAKKELADNMKFEFTVVTKNNVKESFSNLSVLFKDLSEKMEQIPIDLQTGKNQEVTNSIQTLADSISQFSHVAALASLFPDTFTNTTINNMPFNEFFKDFSSILLDFEQALQNNDSVLVGDLSEYEICPRLQSISEFLKIV